MQTKAFENLDDYNTQNLEETLKAKEIEISDKNYKETDDQVIIYLFWGKGCGYCQNFLTYLNSILDEYGKYFKLVSFETWNDAKNGELLNEVSTFLNEPAGGVPYIVIGDKVFAGYAEDYNEGIEQQIKDMYDTKVEDRYDVLEELKNAPQETSTAEKSSTTDSSLIFWNGFFVAVATIIILVFIHTKDVHMTERITELEKLVKKQK